METLLQDIRYATRTLLRRPCFAVVASLTLALGIGATTAIYSVVNAVLVQPLPWPSADRLVTMTEMREGQQVGVVYLDYLDCIAVIAGLEQVLGRLGHRKFELGDGMRAAQRTFASRNAHRAAGGAR